MTHALTLQIDRKQDQSEHPTVMRQPCLDLIPEMSGIVTELLSRKENTTNRVQKTPDDQATKLVYVLALQAHDTASPPAAVLRVLVEGRREVLAELLELVLVLALHRRHRNDGRRLLANQLAEAGLPLDEAIRHLLLAAERRKPDDQLQRVHLTS